MWIHEKLLKFQAKGITINKDWENPHFKSKYATLPEIQKVIEPELTVLKVLVYHTTDWDNLTTHIYDVESKEEITWEFPLVEWTAQAVWSCMTYAKRYNLACLLNLNIDEDDDGEKATEAGIAKKSDWKPWYNDFDKVKDKWEDMIDKGEKTPQDIIKTLESAFRVSKETKANIMQLWA